MRQSDVAKKISVEIPKWALPREEVTFYVKIRKDVRFTKFVVTIPKGFEMKGKINVGRYRQNKNIVEILDVCKSTFSEKDYFGITIASIKPFENLASQHRIAISMVDVKGEETKIQEFVRVFRPYLSVEHIPQEVTLKDGEGATLPVHLKFSGFGDIFIKIDGTVGSTLVSSGERSVMDRLFQSFLRKGDFNQESGTSIDQRIQINKAKLTREIEVFKTKLRDPEYLNSLMQDRNINDEAINFLKGLKNTEQKEFMEIVYGTIEGHMIKQLTDIFARNVGIHSQMDSHTNIITEIKAELTNLVLEITYRDLAGNLYEPINHTVKIIDRRESELDVKVTIPVEVKEVNEAGAYRNVGGMNIQNVT